MIGEMIQDRYVIDSVIGKGSSGTVYKATRLMMGGEVAIKVIDSYLGADRASLDRLNRELKAAEKLKHPHIITVYDSGTTEEGKPFLVMDYLEGISLGDLIKEQGPIAPTRVFSIFKQVCDALGYAHEKGLIHRDIKPENVVLEQNAQRGDYAKVLDFGECFLTLLIVDFQVTLFQSFAVTITPYAKYHMTNEQQRPLITRSFFPMQSVSSKQTHQQRNWTMCLNGLCQSQYV